MAIELKEGERLDDLHRNGFQIIQNKEKFCFGMDAVLLSGFAKVKEGEKVLDIGTGTGIIPILLAAKTPGQHFTGLEIQPESADMARRSVALNHLEEKISIVEGDVMTSNPPYMTGSHGLVTPDMPKAIARHEICCTLEDLVSQTEKLLRPGGRFFMVHRPFRLAEIMTVLTAHHLEPKRMRLVYPFVDKEPNMVLLECIRGGKPRITVEKPLIVYKEPGVYQDEIYTIYGY